MGVRVKVGFKDSVEVQSGQNFPCGTFGCSWSVGRLWRPWTPEGATFGNYLLAGGPWGGGGARVVGVLGAAESPPNPPSGLATPEIGDVAVTPEGHGRKFFVGVRITICGLSVH